MIKNLIQTLLKGTRLPSHIRGFFFAKPAHDYSFPNGILRLTSAVHFGTFPARLCLMERQVQP